ncbi:MAG: tetratricopeptide repeat protein [Candidatus Omnitrophica bacterium]|nr:tetratricopeptide repeat protein [Candidatus Omnitrophota bacterium]
MRQRQSTLRNVRAAAFLLIPIFLAGAKFKPGEILQQDAVTYRAEGRQLQDLGELERASAAYRRAVSLNPGYAEAYNDLGVVLETMGDLENAEEAYRSSVLIKPDFGAAHTNLALLYEESGRPAEAAEHWAARIRLGPPDDPWVQMAQGRMAHHQLPEVESPADAAENRSQAVKVMILTGQDHMDARRWEDAAQEFERALALEPGNSKASRLLRNARQKAAQEEQRLSREMDISSRRVARESELAQRRTREEQRLDVLQGRSSKSREEAWRRQEEALRRQEEADRRREEALARQEEARARKAEARALKRAEALRERGVRQVETVESEPASAKRPWWKFWVVDREETQRRTALKREQVFDLEVDRAQRLQAAQDEALQKAERLIAQPSAIAPAVKPGRPPLAPVVKPPVTQPPIARAAPIVTPAAAPAVRSAGPVTSRPAVTAPVVRVREPSAAEAQRLAGDYVRERSKTMGRARDELFQRGTTAMRQGDYREAAEHFRQVLILNSNDRDAQQALARAERALEKEQLEQGLSGY